MKTRKRTMVIAAVSLVAMLAVTYSALAQPFGPGRHRGEGKHGMGIMRMLHDLDLTDDQKGEVEEIVKRYRDTGKDLRESTKESSPKVKGPMAGGEFDEEAVRDSFQKRSKAHEELFVLRARMMSEIRGVLTEEQREALAEKRAERAEKKRDRFEGRHGHRGE